MPRLADFVLNIPPCSLKALSTNMLYYSGYKLASKMGRELGVADEPIHAFEEKATLLKANIRSRYERFESDNSVCLLMNSAQITSDAQCFILPGCGLHSGITTLTSRMRWACS